MAEPRTHLFDRYLANDTLRMFCGLRDVLFYTHDPGEVSCQVCLSVLEADTLSAEGMAMRKAKDAARRKAVNLLIKKHQTEFAKLCNDAYPACLAHQQALTMDGP